MEKQRWLDELRTLLAARRLPSSYVERVALEMSDHIEEIMEAEMDMQTDGVPDRVGIPADLARAVAAEYRKRLFCRRRPILTFVLLPVPTLILFWMAFLVAQCCLVLGVLAFVGGPENTSALDTTMMIAFELVCDVLMVVPFCLPAVLFCRLARKSDQDWRWPLMTCVILSAWAGLRGSNPVGFGPAGSFGLVRCIVMAMPLAIGIWYGWRCVRRRRHPQVLA